MIRTYKKNIFLYKYLVFQQTHPFHMMFDRDMVVQRAGASIARVIPKLLPSFLASAYDADQDNEGVVN